MPPKIREMTANATSPQNAESTLRRFTLMLSGEDVLEDQGIGDQPLKGLPHERFLLGDLVPIAPILLVGQSKQEVNPHLELSLIHISEPTRPY